MSAFEEALKSGRMTIVSEQEYDPAFEHALSFVAVIVDLGANDNVCYRVMLTSKFHNKGQLRSLLCKHVFSPMSGERHTETAERQTHARVIGVLRVMHQRGELVPVNNDPAHMRIWGLSDRAYVEALAHVRNAHGSCEMCGGP